MSNVNLVTPKQNNSLVKEEIYKKGKQTLSILTTWKKCVLVVDNIPKSKLIDGVKFSEFSNVGFKDGQHENKSSLVIPDELSEIDKKTIKKHVKDGYLWALINEGWKPHKTVYRLKGEFEVANVPVHKVTLFTSEIQLVHKSLSKAEFDNYAADGMPQSEFDDSIDNEAPIFDESTSLSIDDEEIPNFQQFFKVKYDLAVNNAGFEREAATKVKSQNELQYAVVGESWIKRSWYDLTIYEDFDLEKIKIEVFRDYVFGKGTCYETFSITYAGQEFEFRENWGSNSSDYCLIDSDGNQTYLNLFDEEYEEDEDEEYEEDEDGED